MYPYGPPHPYYAINYAPPPETKVTSKPRKRRIKDMSLEELEEAEIALKAKRHKIEEAYQKRKDEDKKKDQSKSKARSEFTVLESLAVAFVLNIFLTALYAAIYVAYIK